MINKQFKFEDKITTVRSFMLMKAIISTFLHKSKMYSFNILVIITFIPGAGLQTTGGLAIIMSSVSGFSL